jgi:predicted dehydrogenase
VLQRSASDASELYPKARVVRRVEEMLSLPEIELIVVTTPNRTHFPIAKQCLEQGRNVVIDKPFTVTSQEARELAQLAEAQGKILSVYQNRRWDGDFQTVQKLVREGTLGRIVWFESHYERFRPTLRPGAWRERDEPGAGILFDLGPHLLDQALVLFGIPEAVFADVRTERDGSLVDDAFDVTFFYPRMRAVLRSSMLVNVPGARFVLHGDRGSFVKRGMDPQEEALKQGEKPHGEAWGRDNEEHAGTLVLADGESRRVPALAGDYRGYYQNVRDAILGKARLAVTPEQGINVMIALEVARESSRTGKRIPWPAK